MSVESGMSGATATVSAPRRDPGDAAEPTPPAGAADSAFAARETNLRRDSLFRRSLAVADMWAISCALLLSAVVFGNDRLTPATLALPILFVAVVKAVGLYDRDQHLLHRTTLDEVPALFTLATLATLLLWLSDGVLIDGALGRRQILGTWILLFVLLIALRALARGLAGRIAPPERCLFVGDTASAAEFREKLASSHAVRAEVAGWIPTVLLTDLESGESVPEAGSEAGGVQGLITRHIAEREIHRVVLGPGIDHTENVLDSIRAIKDAGIKVSVLPDVSRVVSTSIELDRLNGITLLGVRRYEITSSSRIVKRGFDLVGSSLGLLITTPLMLATAVAIKLDSSGPVMFRQPRAGRHGKPFSMLKFRSMVDGADAHKEELRHLNEADGVFKIAADPRTTRVGKLIRRLHIDELPQLLNVLRGDMSLVGPRPLPLDEDRQIVGWHRRRLDLRPGITGPWQVLGGPSQVPLREMVKLDYQYVADWSLWNDIRILLLTIPRIVRQGGL